MKFLNELEKISFVSNLLVFILGFFRANPVIIYVLLSSGWMQLVTTVSLDFLFNSRSFYSHKNFLVFDKDHFSLEKSEYSAKEIEDVLGVLNSVEAKEILGIDLITMIENLETRWNFKRNFLLFKKGKKYLVDSDNLNLFQKMVEEKSRLILIFKNKVFNWSLCNHISESKQWETILNNPRKVRVKKLHDLNTGLFDYRENRFVSLSFTIISLLLQIKGFNRFSNFLSIFSLFLENFRPVFSYLYENLFDEFSFKLKKTFSHYEGSEKVIDFLCLFSTRWEICNPDRKMKNLNDNLIFGELKEITNLNNLYWGENKKEIDFFYKSYTDLYEEIFISSVFEWKKKSKHFFKNKWERNGSKRVNQIEKRKTSLLLEREKAKKIPDERDEEWKNKLLFSIDEEIGLLDQETDLLDWENENDLLYRSFKKISMGKEDPMCFLKIFCHYLERKFIILNNAENFNGFSFPESSWSNTVHYSKEKYFRNISFYKCNKEVWEAGVYEEKFWKKIENCSSKPKEENYMKMKYTEAFLKSDQIENEGELLLENFVLTDKIPARPKGIRAAFWNRLISDTKSSLAKNFLEIKQNFELKKKYSKQFSLIMKKYKINDKMSDYSTRKVRSYVPFSKILKGLGDFEVKSKLFEEKMKISTFEEKMNIFLENDKSKFDLGKENNVDVKGKKEKEKEIENEKKEQKIKGGGKKEKKYHNYFNHLNPEISKTDSCVKDSLRKLETVENKDLESVEKEFFSSYKEILLKQPKDFAKDDFLKIIDKKHYGEIMKEKKMLSKKEKLINLPVLNSYYSIFKEEKFEEFNKKKIKNSLEEKANTFKSEIKAYNTQLKSLSEKKGLENVLILKNYFEILDEIDFNEEEKEINQEKEFFKKNEGVVLRKIMKSEILKRMDEAFSCLKRKKKVLKKVVVENEPFDEKNFWNYLKNSEEHKEFLNDFVERQKDDFQKKKDLIKKVFNREGFTKTKKSRVILNVFNKLSNLSRSLWKSMDATLKYDMKKTIKVAINEKLFDRRKMMINFKHETQQKI